MIQSGVAAVAAGVLPASARVPPRTFPPPSPGLAAVTAVLSGVGLYVGNEWFDWDDAARRFALARIRAWGFDFVCPKVGGYGRTWYRDEAHLRGWAESARGIGLGLVPFLYTIPETGDQDARIAAQIARVTGIVSVDMEDEWGTNTGGGKPGYQGAAMAAFGARYRREAGGLPIIVTGYGDPLTRFGPAATGFPHAEMASWADAYSPQWYIGVFARYHKGGVQAALDWVRSECRQALGPDFPLCPSVGVESIYTPDGRLPLPDVLQLMTALRAENATSPVFVWEYGLLTPGHAEGLLGPPTVRDVRVGRTRQTGLSVVWATHVPARSLLTCRPPDGPVRTRQDDSLGLTHSASVDGLPPGTTCRVTVQALSGGGESVAVPLTVTTAPAAPGVFVSSALAARDTQGDTQGHVLVTLLVANSADTAAPDVRVTALTVTDGRVLSPALLPHPLGRLGRRDWEASGSDRAELVVVITGFPALSSEMTLHIAGTGAGSKVWAATLPVPLPA